MVEYTLRYPGHADLVRSLRALGLLDGRSYVVEGCSITPRTLLARLLDERLPRSGDRLLVYISVTGREHGGGMARVEYVADVSQEELGSETPVLTYATGVAHAWFVEQAYRQPARPGVVPPEALGDRLGLLLAELEGAGVTVSRRVCRW